MEIYNTNLFDYIHEIAKEAAYMEIEEIIINDKYLDKINKFYKKNSIKLFLLKKLDKEYREYLKKIFYIFSVFKKRNFIFLLEMPKLINLAKFCEKKKIQYFFYENDKFEIKKILSSILGIHFRNFFKKFIGKLSKYDLINIYNKFNDSFKNVLCLTDNNYSSFNYLRKLLGKKRKL